MVPIGHDINPWGIPRGQGERLNHLNKDLTVRFAGITHILGEMCIFANNASSHRFQFKFAHCIYMQ